MVCCPRHDNWGDFSGVYWSEISHSQLGGHCTVYRWKRTTSQKKNGNLAQVETKQFNILVLNKHHLEIQSTMGSTVTLSKKRLKNHARLPCKNCPSVNRNQHHILEINARFKCNTQLSYSQILQSPYVGAHFQNLLASYTAAT